MAILNLVNQIAQKVENKHFTLGVFIDLSKAFDTINHNILLDKLKWSGIRALLIIGLKVKWIINSNMYKLMYLNNTILKLCGIPQGSILGLLLFLLYINEIVNVSSLTNVIIFADDTNLFFSDTNLDNWIKKTKWARINIKVVQIKQVIFKY